MIRSSRYKPGDRIVDFCGARDRAGVIVKWAPIHSLVRWDGFIKDKRTSTRAIRPETPEDVGRRDHERTMRAWKGRQPKTRHVLITNPGMLWEHGVLWTPEELREAAAELLQLADWLAAMPVKL